MLLTDGIGRQHRRVAWRSGKPCVSLQRLLPLSPRAQETDPSMFEKDKPLSHSNHLRLLIMLLPRRPATIHKMGYHRNIMWHALCWHISSAQEMSRASWHHRASSVSFENSSRLYIVMPYNLEAVVRSGLKMAVVALAYQSAKLVSP